MLLFNWEARLCDIDSPTTDKKLRVRKAVMDSTQCPLHRREKAVKALSLDQGFQLTEQQLRVANFKAPDTWASAFSIGSP